MEAQFFLSLAFLLGNMDCGMGEPRYEHGDMTRGDDGKKMLLQITRYGKHPQYGKCWTNALEQIQAGCKKLTDDEQSFMALTFANCHLEKAGLQTYPCDAAGDIRNCLAHLSRDAIAFNAYTEFFTHTQDICFFLQSQVWHEQTEETVSRLARSSEDVAVKMETTGQLQEEMMEKQSESLKQQELILANEERLNDALLTSSQDIKKVFTEMKESTQTQKRLFEETFSRVGDIQRVILGEFTWFNSLLFFAAAVVIAYLVTATPRTSAARLWLFVILATDWVLEWVIFAADGTDQITLYGWMWFCRKCSGFFAFFVLCLFAYRYKDFAAVNNALLLEIRRQNSELCRAMKGIGANSYPALGNSKVAAAIQSSGFVPMSVLAGHQPLPHGRDFSDGYPQNRAETMTTIDGYSSEDFTGTDSDPTFVGPDETSNSSDISDTESFTTANQGSRPASRQTSLEDRNYGQLLNQSVNGPIFSHLADGHFESGTSTEKRKRGRPRGSRSRDSTPRSTVRTPKQTHYNLRSRYPQSANNSILSTETVEMFIEKISASFGQRNYRAERVEPARYSKQRNVTSFSSDEEF